MNVKLRHNYELPAAFYNDNGLCVNTYHIDVVTVTESSNINDLDIAVKRIHWFVENELADAVFVDHADTERNSVLALLGLNIVTLPGPPVDQLIGIMLMCKLNAITEGRVTVVETSVSSRDSNGVWFVHDFQQTTGPFEELGWWYDSSTLHNNIEFDDAEDNVVKVSVNPWIEAGLAWSCPAAQSESKVIFGNFSKKNET
jgi:hypothetical protein